MIRQATHAFLEDCPWQDSESPWGDGLIFTTCEEHAYICRNDKNMSEFTVWHIRPGDTCDFCRLKLFSRHMPHVRPRRASRHTLLTYIRIKRYRQKWGTSRAFV